MTAEIQAELAQLNTLPVRQLQARYLEVWGAPTNSRNRDYLIKRIAWRIQENVLGGLSERAKLRLAEALDDGALRVRPPRDFLMQVNQAAVDKKRGKKKTGVTPKPATFRDPRLPPAGSELRRDYRGQQVAVQVLAQGFLYGNKYYPTLSAIAQEITGQHWNGYLFFGLTPRQRHS